jgi:ribosomal protein S18 acetylase RimI-like enzyme
MGIHIRPVEKKDEVRWLELWDGYCQFYKMNVSMQVTSHLWTRILDPDSKSVFSIVAEGDDKIIIGIANYVLHESTSAPGLICCLQDLFVDPNSRARGAGKALIDWLLSEMKAKRWSRVYWHTRENNYRARGLYDKFTSHNDFLRYVVNNSSI